MRPAAGAVPRPRCFADRRVRRGARIDERAQVVEAVGGHQTGGDQLPERRLDFGLEVAGAARQMSAKNEAPAAPR